MSREEKWVAIVTNHSGSVHLYVAHDRLRYRQSGPFYRTTSLQEDAARFDTEGDAKTAALSILVERRGKPFTGGLRGYCARLSPPFTEESGSSEAEVEPSFDWEGAGEDLYAALAVVIDQIDYTNQACRPNEMIGAVLDRHLIEKAKTALSAWMNLRLKARSQNGDGVGG